MDPSEALRQFECAQLLLIAIQFQPDFTELRKTLLRFLEKLTTIVDVQTTRMNPALLTAIQNLSLSLRNEDLDLSEVSSHLLDLSQTLIQIQTFGLIDSVNVNSTLKLYVNREEVLDALGPTPYQDLLKRSPTPFISVEDLRFLVAMSKACPNPLLSVISQPVSIKGLESPTECKELDVSHASQRISVKGTVLPREIEAMEPALVVSRSITGLVELYETEGSAECLSRICSDEVTSGRRYLIGRNVLQDIRITPNPPSLSANFKERAAPHRLICSISLEGLPTHLYTIGRDSTCFVVLPGKEVSRLHAEITWDRGCWQIQDNHSTSGLWKFFHRDYTIGTGNSPALRITERKCLMIRNRGVQLDPGQFRLCESDSGASTFGTAESSLVSVS